MLHDLTAVVLAGGLGTRVKTILADMPKPLAPVAGKPFLHWITAYLARFGIRDFVYSAGYKGEQIAAWANAGEYPDVARRVRIEGRALGTGGGLLNCLDLCGAWVLVANGDSLCLGGIPDLLQTMAQPEWDGGLIGVSQADASRYGSLDFDPVTRRLSGFREKASGSGCINAGVYVFRKSVLQRFPKDEPASIERDLLPRLIAEGVRIRVVVPARAAFLDIGTPETIALADAFIAAHREAFA